MQIRRTSTRSRTRRGWTVVLTSIMALPSLAAAPATREIGTETEARSSYIVQARRGQSAHDAVRRVGGTVTHELGIIQAVAAELTSTEAAALTSGADGLRVRPNPTVASAGNGNGGGSRRDGHGDQ